MAQFDQTNDQVLGYQGTAIEVSLPSDTVADTDLNYLDSVELDSTTGYITTATGADASKYLGIVADSGGIESGYSGRIIRGVRVKKELVGSCSIGDLLEATDETTVTALTTTLGSYLAPINSFGIALEDQTTGNMVDMLVDPKILV